MSTNWAVLEAQVLQQAQADVADAIRFAALELRSLKTSCCPCKYSFRTGRATPRPRQGLCHVIALTQHDASLARLDALCP